MNVTGVQRLCVTKKWRICIVVMRRDFLLTFGRCSFISFFCSGVKILKDVRLTSSNLGHCCLQIYRTCNFITITSNDGSIRVEFSKRTLYFHTIGLQQLEKTFENSLVIASNDEFPTTTDGKWVRAECLCSLSLLLPQLLRGAQHC